MRIENSKLARLKSHFVDDLLLSRFLPGLGFALIVDAKMSALAQFVRETSEQNAWSAIAIAGVSQRALTVVFLSTAVFLFVIRRPVIGANSPTLGLLVALAGTFVLSLTAWAGPAEDSVLLLAASSILMFLGVSYSIISLITLGRCFAISPEARGLVTSGPYSRIRHPLYVSETITALGLLVGSISFLSASVFIVFCLLQYWRACNEERALSTVFPEYAAYCRRTPRFLPGLRNRHG